MKPFYVNVVELEGNYLVDTPLEAAKKFLKEIRIQLKVSDDDNVCYSYFSLDDITENKNTIFNVYENYQREWYDEVGKCADVSHRYVSSHKTKEGAEKYINDRLEETASSLEKIVKALENYQDNIETVAEDLVQIKMIRNNQELFFKGDLELTLPKYFVEEYELGD